MLNKKKDEHKSITRQDKLNYMNRCLLEIKEQTADIKNRAAKEQHAIAGFVFDKIRKCSLVFKDLIAGIYLDKSDQGCSVRTCCMKYLRVINNATTEEHSALSLLILSTYPVYNYIDESAEVDFIDKLDPAINGLQQIANRLHSLLPAEEPA